ncbi:MAG: hypothetical protein ACHQT9_01745 [Candidatus Saccharimonadales bacterium]
MVDDGHDAPLLSQQLLLGVAEELKLPLLQIARQSELVSLNDEAAKNTIQATAETALRLLDNYVLGVRLALEPQQFPAEAVSVSSILYDVSQQLDRYAKLYGVNLELNIAGKYGPVVANRRGLESALVSVGAALIEALPALQGSKQLTMQLATHRSRYGVIAGVYTETKKVSNEALKHGRHMHGKSRQPLINLSHNSGAGIFVADAILHAMDLKLMASRHHRLHGLGTVLQPNNQLQLV